MKKAYFINIKLNTVEIMKHKANLMKKVNFDNTIIENFLNRTFDIKIRYLLSKNLLYSFVTKTKSSSQYDKKWRRIYVASKDFYNKKLVIKSFMQFNKIRIYNNIKKKYIKQMMPNYLQKIIKAKNYMKITQVITKIHKSQTEKFYFTK